jgi:UDP-N-acetylglucosamine--N-acetylmuramyl-(pentapeptide) pyrophosphoryl-undecaprenol N-acetylglucosamine transferase
MGIGVLQAAWLIRKHKPTAVVGFGGYPSAPLLFAAAHTGLPIILHEQNAIMGRANAILLPMAKMLATSFAHVANLPARMKAQIVHTGNPVRPAFSAMRQAPYPEITDETTLNILVLGGSLGAHIFSSVVPDAFMLLPQELRRRFFIIQQCRKEDLEEARSAYAAAGVEAELAPFFTDVPERMGSAHLVITRSGGGSVAEVTAVGRPAIFVPFAGGHAGEQTANAKAVAQAGGAWLIPEEAFTPEALAVRLEALLAMPVTLAKAAAAARAWGTISAADRLADCLYEAAHLPTPKSQIAWADNPDASGGEFTLALSTRELS